MCSIIILLLIYRLTNCYVNSAVVLVNIRKKIVFFGIKSHLLCDFVAEGFLATVSNLIFNCTVYYSYNLNYYFNFYSVIQPPLNDVPIINVQEMTGLYHKFLI